jgi:transcriptional regulator with XRE-family HTH domain
MAMFVSATFISKMERGTGPLPGEETICRMAKILGKDPDVLLAMADKRYGNDSPENGPLVTLAKNPTQWRHKHY